jgi:hypothetical protein
MTVNYNNNMNHEQKIIDFDAYDFSSSTLIKPPVQIYYDENKTNRRIVRAVIDSRDRNKTLYPNPNNYEVEFVEDIQDVIAVELCQAQIPFTQYMINTYNNRIDVFVNGARQVCFVEVGDYDATSLANTVESTLNAASGANIFKVVYILAKDRYIIKSTVPFQLIFKGDSVPHSDGNMTTAYVSNSIGQVMGFGVADYASHVDPAEMVYNNVVNAEYRKNFALHEYVVLSISPFYVNVSTSDVINKSFAIIHKDTTTINLVNNNDIVRKTFNPPIARMARMKLCFKDYYGNRYDFQNHDHQIILHLECLKNCRKYQSFAHT